MRWNIASAYVAAAVLLWAASPARGQLIAPGQPVPRTAGPPVVFVNGYQSDCGSSSFSTSFGIADQVLAAHGLVSLFFDNCTVGGRPSIEKLGDAFGAFLAGLKYDDASAVGSVDVVAHSMGGLVVRAYLSGKQEQDLAFSPPPRVPIRKIVFLATPHFGTPVAQLGFGFSQQSDELSSGSHFLFALNTWNDNTDELRGLDAIAVAGSGGTGVTVMPGFDDGVVSLSSASLGFYRAGRTRILPLCHVEGGGLVTLGGLCLPSVRGVARISSVSDDNARILVSFLSGTTEWQSIGEAAEQNRFLSTGGGVMARPFSPSGAAEKLAAASLARPESSKQLNLSNDEIAYTDLFPAGPATLTAAVDGGGGTLTRAVTLPAATYRAYTLKTGPNIAQILPAAAEVFPRTVAPRMIVAIYGEALSSGIAQAQAIPLPLALSDVQVQWNGAPIGLIYVSPGQINAVLPDAAAGFGRLTVAASGGASGVNLMVEAARPAVFTLDGSGTGAAAVVNVRTGSVVGADNPLRAGDTAAIFLTGLGIAPFSATVNLGGADCPVSYAGPAPGYAGLDQVNCQVPPGLAANPAAPLTVASGGRVSNLTRVAVQ